MLKQESGFTLVELMVAAAIVAALTVVAIPSYKGFQAKARQKEGFNLLNAYYAAASSTRIEYDVFPGNLVQTGFSPTGQLGYRFRAADGPDISGIQNDNGCTGTWPTYPCTCGGACPDFKNWQEKPYAYIGQTIGPHYMIGVACESGVGATVVTADTFLVKVGAIISTSAIDADRYSINHLKEIEMCTDGLR